MLFTKDMASISFDGIRAFFDLRLREGLRIDYKENFPADLAKIITAFANAAGGLILIGISANTTTNEPENIVGVQLRNGLEERVTSIAISNIEPAVYPEVKVVPFKSDATLPDNDRAVIVVRVPESDFPPHIHTANNDIWVRVHNECAHADLNTIEQLIEKRDRGVKARNIARESLADMFDSVIPTFSVGDQANGYYTICTLPAFPTKTIGLSKSVDDFLSQKILPLSRGAFTSTTPKQDRIEFRSIRGNDGTVRDFFSVTNRGAFVNIRPLQIFDEKVSLDEVIRTISRTMKVVADIFEKYQLSSKVVMRITLRGVQNKLLWLGAGVLDENYRCQNETIEMEETYTVDEVRHKETRILYSIYNQMLRSFGASFEDTVIEERIAAALRAR